ncbi:MAG: polysaccharide biosynthesis tyrosine autokinase [Novosphingobium sp.]
MASTPFDAAVQPVAYPFPAQDAHAAASSGRAASGFRYILSMLRANLLLIAAILAAALAFAVIATMLDTPRYTAAATIQISSASTRVLGPDQEDRPVEADYDFDRSLKTQIDILKSRALAQRVVQKLKLASNSQFFTALGMEAFPAGTPPKVINDTATGIVMGGLNVIMPHDSRVVTITWQSTDPATSALIANTYASEFIQSDLQRKFDSSAYARSFVSDQLNQTKARLEESERALNAYSRSAGLIRTRDASTATDKDGNGGGGSSITTSSLLQVNEAANTATARRIEAEGQWRAVANTPLLATKEVLANPTVQELLQQKAKVESDLQQELARHLEDYPTVRSKRQALTVIERQIQQAASNVRTGIQAQYQAAVATEQQLGGEVSRLKNSTLGEQDRTVQYALLAREADTNRQLYDGLLQRYKQLNAAAGISSSNISIIDNADVPGYPSSPNLMKNLVVALVIGSAMAAALVFLKDQFDDSIRVPEDVEAKLGMALLGVVPLSPDGEPETALADPKSPLSEAYNSLRGSLLYSTSSGMPHVLLVTSAQASEGKTTSAVAIASSFARMNRSVLLIDADMRRPSLHRRLGSANDRGLSSLLTSRDGLASATVAGPQANLTILPSGPIPPSPTELISTPRMEEILQAAAGQYELVVIDSPPILGLADAPALAALVDGVVFIVEADRSRRGALKTALRRLADVRPIVLGAVLTKFDPQKAGNRYSEYYGYEYYQYGGAKAD